MTDEQIKAMTDSAFASTNDTGMMGLQRYWYGKGVRDGAALTSAPAEPPKGFALVPVEHDVHASWASMEFAAARALTDRGFSNLTRKDLDHVNLTNVVRQIVRAATDHRAKWPERWAFAAPPQTPQAAGAIGAREQEARTADFARWARHWFGSEADPQSIAKAIACMPAPPHGNPEQVQPK